MTGGAAMRDPVERAQELAARIGARGATTEGERRGHRRHAGSQDGQ